MSTPTNPHQGTTPAPQGENRPNPPALPGSEPDPSYPEVPTGIYMPGAALPEEWGKPIDAKTGRVAANALIEEIEDRIAVLKKVIGRIA